ncbi:Thiol-disulfide isomerase and thioredoxin [Flavobacterium limnosediminis JC2902]|uniref:Thiol-disulfide isomerase and thioredoxin n=1 Tax=Flavobacterium limnosediminis JC2902 TaxID=1341181 RepID=V6ST15_9FLAO|nr:TlpA disulfide reductase family protein [Flavobacterium limnosediminis]ESU29776.1 Thiol-disulfide isomerase and thioredoxin [Flavobacterium limnosediminis JC2902]
MKKLFLTVTTLLLTAAAIGQSKEYATFSATIANGPNEATITSRGKLIKKINVKNGVFKDTLRVKDGLYELHIGEEYTDLYLKNGFDLKMKMDVNQFDESIVYEGSGAAENNFLAKQILLDEKLDFAALMASNETDFNAKYNEILKSNLARLEDKNLSASFVTIEKKQIEMKYGQLKMMYDQALQTKKLNNTTAPSFDYVNYKGGKSKLEDFRGKFVYIDLWATWCGPCRAEIPFLKDVEKKYHEKNIVFMSISIDKQTDMEKWKKMVKDKELGGVQLFADNDWNSKFVQDFKVTGIPRFILIDPNGKVVNADAPRPSSPELASVFDKLLN